MRRRQLQDLQINAAATSQATLDSDSTAHPHPGLWLDKFFQHQHHSDRILTPDDYDSADTITKTDPEATSRLMRAVASLGEPPLYRQWFQRWQESLQQREDVIIGEGRSLGRILIGLGDANPLETSIRLHHTYGVPYLPGSSLKGLAAHFAHEHYKGWQYGSEMHKIAFGTTDSAGYLTFFDAMYIPGSAHKKQPLWPDVITPHHQKYTQNEAAPSDTDSPVPVQMLSTTGSFLIALAGPPLWTRTIFDLLVAALEQHGIGAKTSSGYGRLKLKRVLSEQELHAQAAQEDEACLLRDVEMLPPRDVPQKIGGFVERWYQEVKSAHAKRQIAQALIKKIDDANHKKSREKPWYPDLLAAIQD